MLRVHAQTLGDVTILCLQGGITIGETKTLWNAVKTLSDVNTLVLDFRRVSRVDACGLGLLLEMREYMQSQGTELRLMNVAMLIRQLLQITCLDSVFEISSEAEVLSLAARHQPDTVLDLVVCAKDA